MSNFKTRSYVMALVKEDTEGVLKMPAGASAFTVLREGTSFQGGVESIQSDELLNDIGASEGFVTKETPSGSVPRYMKHSGVEGQAPDWGVMLEAAFGSVTVNSSEVTLESGSTAGDADTRAVLKLPGSHGMKVGQAVLIKDDVNGWSMNSIYSIDTNDASLLFNLAAAPAAGVTLGKAIHYEPAAEGHPSYSAHLWQAGSNSAFHQAMAGVRTTNLAMEFTANQLSTINVDFEGIEFFMNPVIVDSSNNKIDFSLDEGSTEETATIPSDTYKTPIDYALAVQTALNAVSGVSGFTVSFSSSTGKYTIVKASGTLDLLWNSGTNTANTAGTTLGFAVAADDTGALTYTSDNESDYDPDYTPSYDDVSPNVVKSNVLRIGGFNDYIHRPTGTVSFGVSVPAVDVEDIGAVSGVSGKIINERAVTFSAPIYLKKHEVALFYSYINNQTVQVQLDHGLKSGGNWVPGTCTNIALHNAKITAKPIGEVNGIATFQIEGSGFVNATHKDMHLNLL